MFRYEEVRRLHPIHPSFYALIQTVYALILTVYALILTVYGSPEVWNTTRVTFQCLSNKIA